MKVKTAALVGDDWTVILEDGDNQFKETGEFKDGEYCYKSQVFENYKALANFLETQ